MDLMDSRHYETVIGYGEGAYQNIWVKKAESK
jgi:hypothetical protein